jgi:hypothetical protein
MHGACGKLSAALRDQNNLHFITIYSIILHYFNKGKNESQAAVLYCRIYGPRNEGY